eukprot:m.121687 g.121687  ORF g.121687 m.121687 type:complete len:1082 (-) comp28871_c0_seq4:169-3414(-)
MACRYRSLFAGAFLVAGFLTLVVGTSSSESEPHSEGETEHFKIIDDFGETAMYHRKQVQVCNATQQYDLKLNYSDARFFNEHGIETLVEESSFSWNYRATHPHPNSLIPLAWVILIISSFYIRGILGYYDWLKRRTVFLEAESLIEILIGVLGGFILWGISTVDATYEPSTEVVSQFTKETFFTYLLPAIIFADGYHMKTGLFFKNARTILLHAFIGTAINVFLIGYTVYAVGHAIDNSFRMVDGLLFGSIIAAVDPVAVLAVFNKEHVDQRLEGIVLGESILNDGVSVVLYHVFVAVAYSESLASQSSDSESHFYVFVYTIYSMLWSVVIAILIGSIFGYFSLVSLKRLHDAEDHMLLPLGLYAFAYLSYIAAEFANVSGIFSIMTCAMIINRHGKKSLTPATRSELDNLVQAGAHVSESVLFILMGIQVVHTYREEPHLFHGGFEVLFILIVWIVMLLSRGIALFFLNFVDQKIFGGLGIPVKDLLLMAWGGLRGAIAFALVDSLIEDDYACFSDGHEPQRVLTNRDFLRRCTIWLVIMTIMFQGSTTARVMTFLHTRLAVEKKKKEGLSLLNCQISQHLALGANDVAHHFSHKIDIFFLKTILEKIDQFLGSPVSNTKNHEYFYEKYRTQAYESFQDIRENYWKSYKVAKTMGLEEGSPSFDHFIADEVHGVLVKHLDSVHVTKPHNPDEDTDSEDDEDEATTPFVFCCGQMEEEEEDNADSDRHCPLDTAQTLDPVVTNRVSYFPSDAQHSVHKRFLQKTQSVVLEAYVSKLVKKAQVEENTELKHKLLGLLAPQDQLDLQDWLKKQQSFEKRKLGYIKQMCGVCNCDQLIIAIDRMSDLMKPIEDLLTKEEQHAMAFGVPERARPAKRDDDDDTVFLEADEIPVTISTKMGDNLAVVKDTSTHDDGSRMNRAHSYKACLKPLSEDEEATFEPAVKILDDVPSGRRIKTKMSLIPPSTTIGGETGVTVAELQLFRKAKRLINSQTPTQKELRSLHHDVRAREHEIKTVLSFLETQINDIQQKRTATYHDIIKKDAAKLKRKTLLLQNPKASARRKTFSLMKQLHKHKIDNTVSVTSI